MTISILLLLLLVTFVAYKLCIFIYRARLHPLSHIPSPLLPAITSLSLSEMYSEAYLAGQYAFKIKRMHALHGPIIRHALNPFFRIGFMLRMEDDIAGKRDEAFEHLERVKGRSEVLNLSDVYFAFANDLVRNFCFGKDNGLLGDLREAKIQRENLMRLLTGVKINKYFPWMGRLLARVLGEKGIPPAVQDLLRFKRKAKEDIEAVLQDRGNETKGRHSVFHELRDRESLPPEEKSVERLMDEATLLVMAGTESGAKSLQYGSFYLLWCPAALKRLREELTEAKRKSTKGEIGLSELLQLPYLNAVILETNRLTFGVTNRMLRYSPTETLTYTASYGPHKGETYVLPPGTKMSCITWCTHTNEELFPNPLTFDPERFVGQSEAVNRRKRCMMALGKGHRKCLGLNIANAMMCLGLSRFAEYDCQLFETVYADVEFKHDYQIAHPRLDTLGIRVKVEGRQDM